MTRRRRLIWIAALMHLVETMHAGGGFFGHTLDFGKTHRVPGRIDGQLGLDRGEEDGFFLGTRLGQHRNGRCDSPARAGFAFSGSGNRGAGGSPAFDQRASDIHVEPRRELAAIEAIARDQANDRIVARAPNDFFDFVERIVVDPVTADGRGGSSPRVGRKFDGQRCI